MHTEPSIGKWVTYTWYETWTVSHTFAIALVAHGITKRASVNIIGFNSPYWIWAFYGSILADNIAVGVYTTNTPSACQYVAEHSCAELVVAEDETQMMKYIEVIEQLPQLKFIIVYGVDTIKNKPEGVKVKIMSWKEFLDSGAKLNGEASNKISEEVSDRISNQVPGMC